MSSLPHRIQCRFPIILQQRSGFTLTILDYLITGVYQGQNFMELSEGIASMNFREFFRNKFSEVSLVQQRDEIEKKFCQSILYSFPSNDKLMDVFLSNFDSVKQLYEQNMNRITGRILSCDHTFKISKYIGITRADGRFVRQFQNAFIGMNEKGELMIWRLTKSTSSSEIIDLLEELTRQAEKCRCAIGNDNSR